jgi:hypothetical protein
MGIAKFDDGLPEGPKFIAAGPIACWLWFASVCYARRAFTDGFIPKPKVPALVLGLKQPFTQAAKLVEVGLWDDVVGGYQVHDFLDWNPSKKDIESYRASDKERKRRVRGLSTSDTDRTSENVREVSDPPRYTRADAKSKSASESESKSEGLGVRGESAREGAPPHWRKPTGPLIDGRELRAHAQHEWCDLERGLCVWPNLHREFMARGLKSDEELRAWYPAVVRRMAGQPLGDDLFDFWRNQFALWVGVVTTKPSGLKARTEATMDAGKEHLRRQLTEFVTEEGEADVTRRALES